MGVAHFRLSVSKDIGKIVIYIPFMTEVKVKINLESYRIIAIDLDSRYVYTPEVEMSKAESIIKIFNINNDILIIGIKA